VTDLERPAQLENRLSAEDRLRVNSKPKASALRNAGEGFCVFSITLASGDDRPSGLSVDALRRARL
jgi:hypothetical protein